MTKKRKTSKTIGGGGAGNPASLANLIPGGVHGGWPPGASPALRNGLRSRSPAPVVLDPIVREVEAALAVDLPLLNPDGSVPGADRFTVELTAVALLRVRRCFAYLALHGDVDEQGRLRSEVDGLGRAVEHAAKMLDRLGCSPRSRAALGLDVARTAQVVDAATALSEPDPALRARLLVQAGVLDAEGDGVTDGVGPDEAGDAGASR